MPDKQPDLKYRMLTEDEYQDFRDVVEAKRAFSLLGKFGKVAIWFILTLAAVYGALRELGLSPWH